MSRIASKANLAKGGEELRQELLERLIDSRLVGATMQMSWNRNPEKLPLRELPHGSWSNIYLLYVSYCKTKGESAAAKSTFFTVCQEWRACLRFHKRTQHAICETCSRLRMKVRHAAEAWTGLCTLASFVLPPLGCSDMGNLSTQWRIFQGDSLRQVSI